MPFPVARETEKDSLLITPTRWPLSNEIEDSRQQTAGRGSKIGVFTINKADFRVIENVGLRLSYGFEKTQIFVVKFIFIGTYNIKQMD